MNNKTLRLVAVAGALAVSAYFSTSATAQCCGSGWGSSWGTTAYYAPTYATYDTGWYPGYWWNRATARLWGSPTTYVAAYPASYSGCTTCGTSSWWPTSSSCSTCASYAPASSCSTCASPCSSCSTCTAGYAPSSCSSCSSGYVTSYAPSCGCTTCGSSCPSNCGCSACANGSTVSQTTYQQPASGCTCGSHGAQPAQYTAPAPAPAPQPTPAPGAEAKPNYDVNRPPVEFQAPTNGVQPVPGSETEDKPGAVEIKKTDSGASFEPPALFNPKDRTASRASIAPVRTAVYEQSGAYRQASSAPRGPITAEQARKDAIGWASGAN